MYIGEAIRTLLLGDTRITDITTNIHSDVLPQNIPVPAITYYRISGTPHEALATNSKLNQERFQVDAFDDARDGAATLADQIRLVLQKYRGTVDGEQIYEISVASGARDDLDPVTAGSANRRFITSQDFFVFYRPAV